MGLWLGLDIYIDIYFSISEFFNDDNDNDSRLSAFFTNLLKVFLVSSNLNVLTRHIDQAFQSLQILKRRILEEYYQSSDENGRQEYFYLLERVKMLKPLTGDGYFEITKTTITSMVSVRLGFLNSWPYPAFHNFNCQSGEGQVKVKWGSGRSESGLGHVNLKT